MKYWVQPSPCGLVRFTRPESIQHLEVDADYASYIMEYMVCMQKTAHKDMIMKSHLNYSVLQRANRDQGFDFAVLQTLTSEDSENHVSCGKHFR